MKEAWHRVPRKNKAFQNGKTKPDGIKTKGVAAILGSDFVNLGEMCGF